MRKDSKGEGKSFGSFDEVILAYENKSVDVNATINVRHNGDWYKETTVGRVIINAILPEEMDYIDDVIDKKRLSKLVNETYLIAGNQKNSRVFR
jgi:DNA-directed RNA polymerase subunit beta'